MIQTEKFDGMLDLSINCDECADGDTFEGDDFQEALDIAKEEGRKVKKVNGDRRHYCPACAIL